MISPILVRVTLVTSLLVTLLSPGETAFGQDPVLRDTGVQFHLVDEPPRPDSLRLKLPDTDETVPLHKTPLLDERSIASASASQDERGEPYILITLTPAGARRLAQITAANIGRRLAIVVSGQLLVAPVLQMPISDGKVQVTGRFSNLEATALAAAIKGAVVALKPPPRPQVGPAGFYANSWALVVGINAYRNVPRLNYAVPDAKAVADLLPALGFPKENIRLLLDAEATKARIESVLYRDLVAMGKEDRLFVFFAGHGETLPIRGGEEGYLLPVDADPTALPLTAIAMDDVKRISQRLPAKHYFFVMDACFSGFAVTRDIAPRALTDEYLASALREPVVQVLTAGRKGERAIEEGGHGLFTRRLVDGLRGLADTEGRGFVTAAQLAAWIEPRVVRDSKGRMTPQYGKLDGEGQFVFISPGRR